MSSIGPEFPPRLLAGRPSSSDDDDEQGPSPVESVVVGPQVPSHLLNNQGSSREDDEPKSTAPVTAGPQIPLGLLNKQPFVEEEEDDEDDYVPQLPPDLAATRSAEPSASGSSLGKRQQGPTLPSYAPTYDPKTYYSDDDDDDDDFGPKPLPSGMQHQETDAVKEFMEREERRRKQLEEANKPKALQRDEWMLVPPSSSDLLAKLDPTKLKGRQFSRSTAPSVGKQDNSLWTETPAERQQRITDEVSGKKRRAAEPAPVDEFAEAGKKRRRRDDEKIRQGVDEYTRKLRGPALVAQHTVTRNPEDDKKDPGIWDHSRDMGLGGRLMDDDKRNKMIKEAKGLGDRFGTGKSGGFL